MTWDRPLCANFEDTGVDHNKFCLKVFSTIVFRLVSEPNLILIGARSCSSPSSGYIRRVTARSIAHSTTFRQQEWISDNVASFPPFLVLKHFTLGLNRVHELTGLHHLTRAIIAVIYCNNFPYGQGAKRQHFCHGHHGYSQAQVPAFKFMNFPEYLQSNEQYSPQRFQGPKGCS